MKFIVLVSILFSIQSLATDSETPAVKNQTNDCVCRTMHIDNERNGQRPRAENKEQCCSFLRSTDVVQCIWIEEGKPQSCRSDISSN